MELTPFGFEIRSNSEGLVCLTDIWKESGSDDNKRPNDWIARNAEFIETAVVFLNATRNGIIKTTKGKGGGTFAHKQIALAYAKYLSPKLHVLVNQIFFERIEEEKNPQLAIDRAKQAWRKQGKCDKWINIRIASTEERKSFTRTLKNHGVLGDGYPKCTNAIYTHLWGGGADIIRTKKDIPKGSNCRDYMNEVELAGVRLAELLAEESIERNNATGNLEVAYYCENASRNVATAILNNNSKKICTSFK